MSKFVPQSFWIGRPMTEITDDPEVKGENKGEPTDIVLLYTPR